MVALNAVYTCQKCVFMPCRAWRKEPILLYIIIIIINILVVPYNHSCMQLSWTLLYFFINYMDIPLQIFPILSKIVPNSVPLIYIITLYSMRYSHFCCELHRNRLKSRSMQLKSIICSFKHQKIVLFFCFSTLSQLHSAITFEPLMNHITRT